MANFMNQLLGLPYFPRPKLLQAVLQIYLSGLQQGVTLFAPRRQGKTLFVKNELIPAGIEHGWHVVYLDLWARRSKPELALVEGLEATLEQTGGKRYKITKLTAKAKPPGVEVGAEAEPAAVAAETVLENRLAAVLDALVQRKPSQITLLVLDEFQALANARSLDFVAAFRTALQKHQGRLLVFYTGSSRDALNSMFSRQKAPLFESAFPLTLPDLGRAFVVDRAEFLRERTDLVVDIDALESVFERLGRSPEYLNAIIVNLMISGHADVDGALQAWVESQRDAGFGAQLEKLNATDRAVLHMLALRDHPKAFTKEALTLVQSSLTLAQGNLTVEIETKITPSRIQTSMRRLMRHELVAPTGEYGDYEIGDRGLAIWLREAENPS